jgi:hypothetical protein
LGINATKSIKGQDKKIHDLKDKLDRPERKERKNPEKQLQLSSIGLIQTIKR